MQVGDFILVSVIVIQYGENAGYIESHQESFRSRWLKLFQERFHLIE